MSRAAIDTRVALETPEHVVLPVAAAGPAARAVAYGIDLGLRGAFLLTVFVLASAVFPLFALEDTGVGMGLFVWFLLDWGWYVVFETYDGGRSPGKRVMRLRVVRADGSPIGARDAMLRNLLRAADGLPLFYVVGAVVTMVDPRFRRLGDLVAGTLVIHEANEEAPSPAVELYPPVGDAERPRLPRHRRVEPADHRALEEFVAASERHGVVWSEWVASRVVDGFSARYHVAAKTPVRTLQLLVAAARADAPEIERAAASGRDDARVLGALLLDAQLAPLTAAAAPAVVRTFRNLVGELGRLRAGASSRARAAEALAAEAQRVVYRDAGRAARFDGNAVARLLIEEFPAALRANRGWMALSAALFLIPFAYGMWGAATDPAFVEAVVPAETRDLLGESYRDGVARSGDENALMAGFYVQNNVGIALRAVAGGIFLGLGSAWTLLWNGLAIGSFAGWIVAEGLGGNFLRFTSGHSTWELTAIVVAGAAGLRLGSSFVVTEGRTRGASLRAAGPDVLRLTLGAAAMLLIAAAIEGFWSAGEMHDAVRAAFAIAQAGLVWAWLTGRVRWRR
ncbi:MAG: stage II sporulation protein M [Myxococcota bacterium]